MSQLEGCTVYLSNGNITKETNVLFKENGWVRVGTGPEVVYHSPGNIDRVEYDRTEVRK